MKNTNYNFYAQGLNLSDYERKNNRVSFLTLLRTIVGDHYVMVNNVPNVDPYVWDTMNADFYADDEDAEIEVYQWLVCHLDDYQVKELNHYGIYTGYSDALGCDVIAVTHWGTPWESVDTCAVPCYDYDACYHVTQDED